ncbi:ATP-binding protein [Hamadaea tsunoensis]|uniref:ATP-binding protein n=1 Tax=Hamadaea tsunoensis TaxID=53368 RepID=UPI00047FFAEF|nr:ATP-binding protein [Hamadaea tsunoensis]
MEEEHGWTLGDPPQSMPVPPSAPDDAEIVTFGTEPYALRGVRDIVKRYALKVGLSAEGADDLVMAVNEVATNSLAHGGGSGTVLLWIDGGFLVCEVRDRGRMPSQRRPGRHRPGLEQLGGRGLWMAGQLCDLVRIRTSSTGTSVRLHKRLP